MVDGLSIGGEAAGEAGFARHDGVHPVAADEGGKNVTEGRGDVEEADDGDSEGIGWCREGFLDGDVEDVESAKGDACEVDCEKDCGET